MVLREDDQGVIAIGQPSHAWISGQIARAWGNHAFGTIEPHEEVCLAAEQHDAGMAAWDLAPTLNPETGLPHSFIQMPLHAHLAAWREGPRRVLAQSRYAAVLVSMHGCRLYERRDLSKLDDAERTAVRAYLDDQKRFQHKLLAALRDETSDAAYAPEGVARNSQLVWTWDFLSLALCLDWAPCTARQVPTAEGQTELRVVRGEEPRRVMVDPWPFSDTSVKVRCDGRRLGTRYESDQTLADGLARAPWETLEFELAEPR